MKSAVALCVALGSGLLAVGTAGPLQAEEDEVRILRKEVVVEAPRDAVWHAWTTEEGLSFISEASRVELVVGGPYEWFLDLPPASDGKRGGEGARVLAFLPGEMLAFAWTFPPSIPELREAGERTQVVVRLDSLPPSEAGGPRTRVRLAAHGWQEGEAWKRGWDYFDHAWGAVLGRLQAHFAGDAEAEAAPQGKS